MQDDDTANPGMLWVLEGATLWDRKPGTANRACADCHGDARVTMKGVAARHPAFEAAQGRPISLEQRIDRCRTERQGAPPLAHESRELLALTAHVARQSRGLPIAVTIDGARGHSSRPAAPSFTAGRASSISPAASVTTTTGADSSPAMSSRRDIRPATRSTGWSGRASARSSAGSATVWWESVPSPTRSARRSWSIWSCSSCGARGGCSWTRPPSAPEDPGQPEIPPNHADRPVRDDSPRRGAEFGAPPGSTRAGCLPHPEPAVRPQAARYDPLAMLQASPPPRRLPRVRVAFRAPA